MRTEVVGMQAQHPVFMQALLSQTTMKLCITRPQQSRHRAAMCLLNLVQVIAVV
jgi:hypothetical protein